MRIRAEIFALIIVLALAGAAYSEDLIDRSRIKVPDVDELNMSSIKLTYVEGASAISPGSPEFNLLRMKRMNPDFSAYPDATGIIWLKHAAVSRAPDGGMEVIRLFVILGRQGLSRKWLTWNIPVPSRGSVDILESSVYDFSTLAKITTVTPDDDSNSGVRTLKFMGLPENFILVVSWRENLPEQISMSGLFWFQEDLRVWESIVEVNTPQELEYKTFPAAYTPEINRLHNETEYIWRRINIEPYMTSGELARLQRQGVTFSAKGRDSGYAAVLRDSENTDGVNIPADLRASPVKLVDWLYNHDEIELTEGAPRKIPPNVQTALLTKREKLLLANSWLKSQKVDARLVWQLPFEPDKRSPLCSEMFYSPVLEVHEVSGLNFHDMKAPSLLAGAKIYEIDAEKERIASRRIPSSKMSDNALITTMNLRLDDNAMLSGTIKISLGGSWNELLLNGKTDAGTLRGAVLTLFPTLKNFSDVKYKVNRGKLVTAKEIPEISFTVENLTGVAGTGQGLLAIIPFFEPAAMRKLGAYESPIEALFPFVVEQNLTILFPRSVKESLLSGKIDKNPDKINFSQNYNNRRHRLEASARFEQGLQTITTSNVLTLRRCLEQWRAFSARNIPVK